jgi:crossover junction endodeoxyribonuclease RuvC
VPKPADAADSLAIAICHAWRSPAATDSVNLTPAQKAWLAAERAAKTK